MFTGTIFVDDTCQACTIHTIFTVDTICSIIAVLDGDINRRPRLSICTIYAIGASRTRQADMAFRAILAIDSFHGHTILTIFTFDGDTVFAVNTNTGLAVPATDADATGSTIFAILAVYSQFFHGHILIHEDGDVAIFINFRSQVVSRVFMVGFLGRALNLHGATQLSCIFGTRVSSEFQALICQTRLQRFQLCHVDGVSFLCTCSYAVDLAGYCAISFADGYSCIGSLPNGSSFCRILTGSRIISFSGLTSYRGFGSASDGYAAFDADFCVVANGYDVGSCRFIVGGIGRTDDDVVLLVRQFVVVAEDDIGLIFIYVIAADLIFRTDDIVIFAVGQFVLEAIDEVVLRRRVFCISAIRTRDFVADTGNLGHVGFIHNVAAAHDHDLSAAIFDSSLQSLTEFRRIRNTA